EDAINNSNLTQPEKELKRKELFQDVVNNGNEAIVNDYIREQNLATEKDFYKYQHLQKVLGDAIVKRSSDGKVLKQIVTEDFDPADIKKVIEDYPELKQYFYVQSRDNGKQRIVINQQSKFGNYDDKSINTFFGELRKSTSK